MLAQLWVDSCTAQVLEHSPKIGVYIPTKQMAKFSMGEGHLSILQVRQLLCLYMPGFQDQTLVITQEFTLDGRAKPRLLSQFLDTFCTEPKAGWKQLSIGLKATTLMGDNVFLGTPEFPSLPTSGPAMLM